MRCLYGILCAVFLASPAMSQIINPGFESGFEGWTLDGDRASVALSDDGRSGLHAAKLTAQSGVIKQTVSVMPGRFYELSAEVKGALLLGVKTDGRLYFDRKAKGKKWRFLRLKFHSGSASTATIFASFNSDLGRIDDFVLKDKGRQSDQKLSHFVLSKSSGGTGLSPTLPPSENFDLKNWYLSIPSDEDNNEKADSIYEAVLSNGFENPSFFYTAEDGGMVFRTPISGAKTSKNTKYTRTELREMLRNGNTSIPTAKPGKNNWVIGTASPKAKRAAGAIDGKLKASLKVDHVTKTGNPNEVGRLIIGQIHGWKNEPIRLYYRLLPGHKKGSLYFAHESQTQTAEKRKDTYYDLIGSRASDASEPKNGIALGEVFSYQIELRGAKLTVEISQNGKVLADRELDISHSGYDIDDEYLYFKAGVYNQNATGSDDDFVQATFYRLDADHE